MLDELYKLFQTVKTKMAFVNVVATVEQIVDCFEKEFKEDANAKNAALDCVIKMLETYKVEASSTDAPPA